MFATDPLARFYARQMVDAGMDKLVEKSLRTFCYLPFSHSEITCDQRLSLQLNQELDSIRFQWAQKHADVIERFSRFPHRNHLLGRIMTFEEEEFLRDGGFAG
ncbi:hypothetical protein PS861_01472 [Pseudomonas fluorescens]|nr:hypothetical protein PS861_01472 [Pseudomonas fluorescens]